MPYELHYLNRRNSRVWVIPLAGTTITRRSALLPANSQRPVLRLDYAEAIALRARLCEHVRQVGLPGSIFTVWVLS